MHICKSGLTNEGQTNGWDDRLCAGGNGDMILHARTRLNGLADVPDWTGKPSLPYDDPHALRFLGQPLYPAQSNESLLDADTIGKGRPDNCNCQLPGSVVCVRFHVAEKRIKLKQELGSAFYAMGFDRIGEDAALTWRKDEEKQFNTVIQNNLPSSKYRFMEEVFAAMGSKARKDIVNYYFNVFQVRRRAYQNRLTPNHADRDDDSLEPGFLHIFVKVVVRVTPCLLLPLELKGVLRLWSVQLCYWSSSVAPAQLIFLEIKGFPSFYNMLIFIYWFSGTH